MATGLLALAAVAVLFPNSPYIPEPKLYKKAALGLGVGDGLGLGEGLGLGVGLGVTVGDAVGLGVALGAGIAHTKLPCAKLPIAVGKLMHWYPDKPLD